MAVQVQTYSDTLEESIGDTILRDLKNIWIKVKYVIIPRFKIENDPDAIEQLRNWDLWGPLLICLALSTAFNLGIKNNGKSFSILFMIMWGGAFVVTINTKLMGGHISFFQCVCILGYCVFPVLLASVGVLVMKWIGANLFLLKLIIAGVSVVWSTFSALSFMNVIIEENKKLIATYPIFLFYLFIAWFVVFM